MDLVVSALLSKEYVDPGGSLAYISGFNYAISGQNINKMICQCMFHLHLNEKCC